MNNKNTLEQMRIEIDAADDKLLEALAERMAVVKKVGIYKKEHNIKPLAPERWQKVLEDKKQKAVALDLSPELVTELYETIHKHALKQENEIQNIDS